MVSLVDRCTSGLVPSARHQASYNKAAMPSSSPCRKTLRLTTQTSPVTFPTNLIYFLFVSVRIPLSLVVNQSLCLLPSPCFSHSSGFHPLTRHNTRKQTNQEKPPNIQHTIHSRFYLYEPVAPSRTHKVQPSQQEWLHNPCVFARQSCSHLHFFSRPTCAIKLPSSTLLAAACTISMRSTGAPPMAGQVIVSPKRQFWWDIPARCIHHKVTEAPMRHIKPTRTLGTIAANLPGAIAATGEKYCLWQLDAVPGIVHLCWCLRCGTGLPTFTPSDQEACRRRAGRHSYLCWLWATIASCRHRLLRRCLINDQLQYSWHNLVYLRTGNEALQRA